MKILRLDLKRFGPFTDLSLDLADGQEGLHVVYGPNEAGKSSSLRALHQLLYGIPARSADNFLHAHSQMRIGALLRGRDGTLLECLRRKGNKNTLRAPDDEAPLDDARLAQMLGGLDEETFRRRYGINYEQLVAGGKEIVAGHGDLGQSLFAAGAGIADLRVVQQRLEAEAGDLFKPNAKNPRVNSLLSQWKSRRDEARQLRLSTSDWKHHDEALQEAKDRQQGNRQAARRLQGDRDRLGRIRDAIPLIATLRRLEGELAALNGVPLLADDFSQRRAEAQSQLASARVEADEAQAELEAVTCEMAALEIPAALLECAEQITRLFADSGAVHKAQRDVLQRRAELAEIEADLHEMLKKLGAADLDLAGIEQLRLPGAEVVGIQDLAGRRDGLEAAVRQAERQLARFEQRLERMNEQLADLPEPRDSQPLREALRTAERDAELSTRLCELDGSIESLVADAETQLAALGLWQGALDEAVRLAVPDVETCDRWSEELQAAESLAADSQSQLDDERRKLVELERRIEELRLAQDVPTEDDLSAARAARDRGWSLVRRAWIEEEMDEAEVRPFAGEFASAGDLADAFDRSLRRADETVDRLRREAERVAEKSRLLTERHFCGQRLELLSRQTEAAQQQVAERRAAWHAVWHPLQIEPRTPREMRGWLRRHAALVALQRNLRELRAERDDVRRRLAEARQLLGEQLLDEQLVSRDSTAVACSPPLAELLGAARKRLAEVDDAAAARTKLAEQRRTTETDLAEARQQHDEALAALDDWLLLWTPAAARLGLPPDATPAQANVVIDLRGELLARRKEADKLRERIEGIGRDAASFAERVQQLARELAPDLAADDATGAAEQLQRRLSAAREADARRVAQRQREERETKRLRKARRAEQAMNELLAALCGEAGCASPEELPDVEQQSREKHRLHVECRAVRTQLESLAAGAAVDEFRTTVEGSAADDVAAALETLAGELAQLDRENDELLKTIGSEQNEISRMDGSAKAAEAETEAQCLLAEIRARAEDYARLRLATAILAGAVERYRQRHQGPVLERASELFAELTLGSFTKLQAEFGEANKPELVGVRPGGGQSGGQAVRVDGMSEGTCDQLFLALRLASLEHDLSRREPIPLVVDDVMIMFDDDRAVAALKALARLSEQTQVILFTHHEHLVQLARDNLTDDVLFVHQLDHRAAPSEAPHEAAKSVAS